MSGFNAKPAEADWTGHWAPDHRRNIMNRRSMLALYALGLCAGTMTTSGAIAQQKSLKEQLVGNWTFVSSIDTNKDGTKTDRFGPNAKGLVMFDPTGRFSFFISRANISKFAANNVN